MAEIEASAATISLTAFSLAQRFLGIKEVAGSHGNPAIVAMLQLDSPGIADDEIPWCSAFVNYIAWLLKLPRSHSLAARSWLAVGVPVAIADALVGNDVVILQRGEGIQPGPNILAAPGHVGFFAGVEQGSVHLLGGNQGDSVSIANFSEKRILGIRRLL